MCGVITKTISLSVLSVETFLKSHLSTGMSPRSGTFTVDLISFFWMSPARMIGVSSLTVRSELASRVEIVGGCPLTSRHSGASRGVAAQNPIDQERRDRTGSLSAWPAIALTANNI